MPSQSVKRFYNFFAVFYWWVDIFLMPQKRKMASEVNALVAGDLLEIGVGTGSHIHLYRNQTLYAVDLSEKMLLKAIDRNRANSHFMIMQGEYLGFKNESFDAVVLSHILSVVNDPETLIQEAHRVLKPNGILFVLNHFAPDKNWLKWTSNFLQVVTRTFHFKLDFQLKHIKNLPLFDKQKEQGFGKLTIKLLIFKKR
jgi:phosphatidylethanolamine/phosphatidyl-N-methylethanolamine N-methyltransferase